MIRRSPSQLSEFDGDSTNGRPKGETSSSNSRSSVISSSPSLLKPEDVNREVERLCRIFQSQSTGDLLTFTRDHSARDPLRLDAAISAFDYVDRNRGGKQTAAGQEQTVPTVASASSAPANSTQVNDRRQSGSERRELPPEQNWGLGGEAVAQPVPSDSASTLRQLAAFTADRDAAKTAIASVLSLLESKKALSGDIVRNQIISDLAGTDIGKELFDELRLDETATCETESLPTTSDDKLALAISSLVDKNQTIMNTLEREQRAHNVLKKELWQLEQTHRATVASVERLKVSEDRLKDQLKEMDAAKSRLEADHRYCREHLRKAARVRPDFIELRAERDELQREANCVVALVKEYLTKSHAPALGTLQTRLADSPTAAVQALISILSTTIETLRQDSEAIKLQMQSRSEAEGAELLARLAIAEATIRQLKDQFKSRETDIIETKKNFDDACKESQILKLDLKRLKESNSRMKIESLVKERTIKDLNTACETHYRVEQDLYGKVKSLQSSIHNKDALIKDLRAKLDALMSELAPIKQTLQQLDALKQVHSKCKGDFARKELLVQQWKQRAEKSEKARSLLQELQSAKHHRPTAFHQPANPDAISPFTTSTAAAPHFDTTSYAPQPAAQADWPQRPRSAPTFDGRRPGRRGVPDTASPPRRASPSRPSPQRLRGRANEDVRLEAVVDGVARCAATAAVRHAEEAVARWREQLAPQPDLAAGGEKQAGGRKIERVARELLNVDYELILRGKTETPESVASALRAIIDEASQADWNDAAQTNLSTRICVYLTAVLSQSYCKSPTPFPIAAL